MINTLATILISALVSVSSFFGLYKTVTPEAPLGSTLPIAGTTYNLSGSGVSSSATSITLQSLTIPQTGQPIIDADMSSTFYLTLEPGNKTRQEIVSCTTVTQNSGGTATLSGCSRGLSPITPYTASTTLSFVHAGGSQVIFSDPPQLFNLYPAKDNTETITGAWNFPSTAIPYLDQFASSTNNQFITWKFLNSGFVDATTTEPIGGIKTFTATTTFNEGIDVNGRKVLNLQTPTANSDAANKSYVDGVVTGGAADANTTTKGLVEEATVAEIDAESSTGGTGAKLFMTPATFASSKFSSHTASTTQYSAGSQISTTTATITGKKYFFAVSFSTADSLTASLYLHQEGTNNATTTLQGSVQCDMGGVVSEKCPITFMGTYLATTTEAVQVYVGTDASTKVTVSTSRSANIIVIEF